MDANVSSDRIAVLIDADNTSPRYSEALLDEIAKFGNPTIKRAYGDWSSPRLGGWSKELNARAIRGMHQGAFTSGKNATDSALIIDAMDLLYAGNVEAFALVTSDSDFTSLALRLRESGKVVYGLGLAKTPGSLQNACDKFIRLELLGEVDDEPEQEPALVSPATEQGSPTPGPDAGQAPEINLQSALTKAVNAVAEDDGWARLSTVGGHLRRTHPAFDPRAYGDPRLGSLVEKQPFLETRMTGNQTSVRVKGHGKGRKAPAASVPAPVPAKEAPAKKAAAKKEAAKKEAAKKPTATKTATRVTTRKRSEPAGG